MLYGVGMGDGNDFGGAWPQAEEWFFFLLFQAVRRREAAFAKALAPMGMDVSRWRVLSVVRRLAGCTMNELSEFTTTDRTTLTRVTDQLSTAGLIERQGSPIDRRRVCLVVTEAGEAVFGRAMTAMREVNLNALDGVEDHELRVMKTTLSKVLHKVAGSEAKARAILEFARI